MFFGVHGGSFVVDLPRKMIWMDFLTAPSSGPVQVDIITIFLLLFGSNYYSHEYLDLISNVRSSKRLLNFICRILLYRRCSRLTLQEGTGG